MTQASISLFNQQLKAVLAKISRIPADPPIGLARSWLDKTGEACVLSQFSLVPLAFPCQKMRYGVFNSEFGARQGLGRAR